ncbi:MAG: Grx4 family monothiol glutaredoxin [Lysobacterales bacterium]
MSQDAVATIESLLADNRIVLFMKGTPQAPQCGFSASASGILNSLVDGSYATFNVLEDEGVREAIKTYGDWPTIPQLYIDRELVGGSDIVDQMFNSGELHQMLGMEPPDRTPPEITISDQAADAIRQGMESQPGADLHFKVDEYWRCQFSLEPASGGEIKSEAGGIVFHMDINTAQRARGANIGFEDAMQGSGLTIDLPQAPPPVLALSVTDLKQQFADGTAPTVYDVRPVSEQQQASLDFTVALTREEMQAIKALPKDTAIAFMCHHGRSSAGTAEHFRKQGFTKVYNITGGINAWSNEVDSSVPTY